MCVLPAFSVLEEEVAVVLHSGFLIELAGKAADGAHVEGFLLHFFFLCIKLLASLVLGRHLDGIDSGVALERSGELVDGRFAGHGTQHGLAGSGLHDEGRRAERHVLDGVAHGAFLFHHVGEALGLRQLGGQHLGLLVLHDFACEIFPHVFHRPVSFGMHSREDGHEHVVVVAAFIERGDVAHFRVVVEDPSHGLAGVAYAAHIVLVAEQVLALLQVVAALQSVGLDVFLRLVGGDEVAEVVVSLGVGFLAEFNRALTHKKGAVAAARRGDAANPKKESSGSQFYIVQDAENCSQLDGEYTVFGETINGLDIIDKIASVDTDRRDRPVQDIHIISIRPVLPENEASQD